MSRVVGTPARSFGHEISRAPPDRAFEEVRWQSTERSEGLVMASLLLAAETTYDLLQGILREEHFYSDGHRWIWRAVSALLEAGKAVDVVAVANWLHAEDHLLQVGGSPYLAELVLSQPAVLPKHLVEHAQTIRDYWRLRQARAVALVFEGTTRAALPLDQIQPLVEETEASFGAIAHLSEEKHLVVLRDGMTKAYETLVAASTSKGLTGISTMMPELDRLTTGLHRGDLYIVAGRPGHGKTAFTVQLLLSVAHQQIGAALFSLEMPEVQLIYRLLSSECEIDHARFRNPATLGPYWDKLCTAIARLGRYPLWIDDQAAITLPEIRARVRKLKASIRNKTTEVPTETLGVVAIDYLQLMENRSANAHSREQEISGISRGLKQLAKEEDIAVIALSQLNRKIEDRGGDDRRPRLSDLRESGAIEQDADTILFINRPELYSDDAKWRGVAEAVIGKQRNGPLGVVRMGFSGEHVRFRPLEQAEYHDYDDFQEIG